MTAPSLTIGDPAQVTIGWTVTNLGAGPGRASSWYDDVVASPDATAGNGDDILLARFAHAGALDAGKSYTQSETFLLPPSFQGRYHLFVHTDATGVVFENGSETNNVSFANGVFDVSTIPYADLVVSTVTAPASARVANPSISPGPLPIRGSARPTSTSGPTP